MEKWIDFQDNRCKYVKILQDLKKIFKDLQNYSQKDLLVTLLIDVKKYIFNDKSCVFS